MYRGSSLGFGTEILCAINKTRVHQHVFIETDFVSKTHFKGSSERTEKTEPELTCLRRVRERVCARRGGGIRGMHSESDRL